MVHHQRYSLLKKVDAIKDDEEAQAILVMDCSNGKRTRPQFLTLLILSLLSCAFIVSSHIFGCKSTFSLLYSAEEEGEGLSESPPCSSVSDGSICCDRSSVRTDVCVMKGDVRTHSASSSVFVYASEDRNKPAGEIQRETVKPYTRKWETSVMKTIDELSLVARAKPSETEHKCDVIHDVPAVFFSTGGYTGNVYHEFNDGLLPLYITSQRYKKNVVFVILEYHEWWITKYETVLKRLSAYAPIDFTGDTRTHCFPEAIVGLKIHNELSVDPSLMHGNKGIVDFRRVLDRAYRPRIKDLIRDEKLEGVLPERESNKPKLLILSRNGSRSITNEHLLVRMAEETGFSVHILSPDRTTEMAKIYRAMNSSDVMIGVHGAAMTHFLFMRPGSTFIQIVPLGTDWAAATYYGEPAQKLGLNYIGYEILPRESSLSDEYDQNDAVLRDPNSVTQKGWEFTKSIYLDGQKVRLDLGRFRKHLVKAYKSSLSKITHDLESY